MRFNRNLLVLATVSLLGMLGGGCGGLSASHSVSPATFLMPGLLQTTPQSADPAAPAPAFPSNAPIVAQAQ